MKMANRMSKIASLWKTILAGGAGVAALAAVNASIRRNSLEPEENALGGQAQMYPWKHGQIYYRSAGQNHSGLPLVFVHGIGAGVSSFMWRKNFDPLSDDFRVYALDLLGFGFSDKPATANYSADLYVELISDFVRDVVGAPANIIASSLGAAYCVRTADEHPGLINSLILNSCAGYDSLNSRPGMAGAAFYGLLQSPVLGTSFYNVMASERSIREFAKKQLFFDQKRVTDRLVANLYASSHQPGPQHAIAAYLSGYLNIDPRSAFARLSQPVILVCGKQDLTTPFNGALELAKMNPRTRLEVFEHCRMMPEQEHPERFNALALEAFLARSAAA